MICGSLREANQATAKPRETPVRGAPHGIAGNLARAGLEALGKAHRGVELSRGAGGEHVPFVHAQRCRMTPGSRL